MSPTNLCHALVLAPQRKSTARHWYQSLWAMERLMVSTDHPSRSNGTNASFMSAEPMWDSSVSSDLEAQELTQSWSFNICVQSGDEASFQGSASVGMYWRYRLASLDAPWPLCLELQLGYPHLPPLFWWRPEQLIFVPWNAEKFLTCLSMTSHHFLSATATTSACKSMQGKVRPSGLKVFKGMLLPWSKIVSVLTSGALLPSSPFTWSGFGVGGPERGDRCSYHLK